MPPSFLRLTALAHLRDAFGVTSPSGLDRPDRAPSEADDRARGRLLRDTLRDWLWRARADTERLFPAAGEGAASASDRPSPPSSLVDIASCSALLLVLCTVH